MECDMFSSLWHISYFYRIHLKSSYIISLTWRLIYFGTTKFENDTNRQFVLSCYMHFSNFQPVSFYQNFRLYGHFALLISESSMSSMKVWPLGSISESSMDCMIVWPLGSISESSMSCMLVWPLGSISESSMSCMIVWPLGSISRILSVLLTVVSLLRPRLLSR